MNSRLLSKLIKARHRSPDKVCLLFKRAISNNAATDYQSKYTQKLRQRAEESGLSILQLLEKAKAEEAERRKSEAKKLKEATPPLQKSKPSSDSPASSKAAEKAPSQHLAQRKDAPPFKPLSSILNIPRILSTPHTPEQISALWTAYHASRSNGTGRGYVCASVPLDMFHKIEKTGRQYPTFVLPLPRIQPEDSSSVSESPSDEENVAHEFFYLQWDFHAPPEVPLASDNLFAKPAPQTTSPNPASATVLFASLQEYKLRGAFATPYLVLTMYTDLAATHGLVLLRGEITPSTSAGNCNGDRYMLGQEDAQVLTLTLQKLYLWNKEKDSKQLSEGERLLRAFHEKPEEFKWQDLLEFSKLTV